MSTSKARKKKPDPAAATARVLENTLLDMAASNRGSDWLTFDRPVIFILEGLDWFAARQEELRQILISPDLGGLSRPVKVAALLKADDTLRETFQVVMVDEIARRRMSLPRMAGLVPGRLRGPLLRGCYVKVNGRGGYLARTDYYTCLRAGEGHRWVSLAGDDYVKQSKFVMRAGGHPGSFTSGFYDTMGGRSDNHVDITLILAAYVRRCWRVSFRPDGCAAELVAPTDPAGVRELLACRDLGEGETRRKALLHWVKAHRRRKPATQDELTSVRAHLRGCRGVFRWYDLLVNVSESDDDTPAGGER